MLVQRTKKCFYVILNVKKHKRKIFTPPVIETKHKFKGKTCIFTLKKPTLCVKRTTNKISKMTK
jgi:hypothetical protein